MPPVASGAFSRRHSLAWKSASSNDLFLSTCISPAVADITQLVNIAIVINSLFIFLYVVVCYLLLTFLLTLSLTFGQSDNRGCMNADDALEVALE